MPNGKTLTLTKILNHPLHKYPTVWKGIRAHWSVNSALCINVVKIKINGRTMKMWISYTPYPIFFLSSCPSLFQKIFDGGWTPWSARPREVAKKHQNAPKLSPVEGLMSQFSPPLNISEKKTTYLLYLYVGLHLQKMFQFVEFVVHVTRFGGKKSWFLPLQPDIGDFGGIFLLHPPPSHHQEIRQFMLFFYTT